MTKTGIPYLDFTCNPGGFGCSAGCPTCWARALAPRIGKNVGCPDCAAFRVHFHPERLGDFAKRKKPAVIGVQFTGELFDDARSSDEIDTILAVIEQSPQHEYVFLTQEAKRMAREIGPGQTNWWTGVTVHNQWQLECWLYYMIGCDNVWLSVEPMQAPIDLMSKACEFPTRTLAGVIIGCDNSMKGPQCSTSWVRSLVGQCSELGVPAYVKQLRDGVTGRLLTKPDDFPPDLRVRQLPWTLMKKEEDETMTEHRPRSGAGKIYAFHREATADCPAGLTISKRNSLPEGEFGVMEYHWPDLILWFVEVDEFTCDERQDVYLGMMANVDNLIQSPLKGLEADDD